MVPLSVIRPAVMVPLVDELCPPPPAVTLSPTLMSDSEPDTDLVTTVDEDVSTVIVEPLRSVRVIVEPLMLLIVPAVPPPPRPPKPPPPPGPPLRPPPGPFAVVLAWEWWVTAWMPKNPPKPKTSAAAPPATQVLTACFRFDSGVGN